MSRPEPKPARKPGWAWLIFVAVVAVLVATGTSVVYTNRAVHQLCGVLSLLADNNPPPSTDRGAQLLREAQRLQSEYHCK